jgi:hypothetical protein
MPPTVNLTTIDGRARVLKELLRAKPRTGPGSWMVFSSRGKPATIEAMLHRFKFALVVFVAGFGLIFSSVAAHGQDDTAKRGRKYKTPPPTARIEVTIVRDTNGKPIENAAVVFHPMVGEKDEGNMELKTNEDGKTIIDVLPIGDTVRLQVIARGFQTYGEDYKVDKADMAIDIRMKRPGEQYSIYKSHDTAASSGKSTDAAPAGSTAPAAAPDKPAGANAAPPSSQPSQPQNQ